ncbi:hypothetical protein [Leptospira sp. GIMC2001]|uniref:hypothetical protein n=1 Tax=Leptospira sp. GIMC2001 TaxID=1513297 RepID=UPI00234BEE82|nr:hypothetical protein [Leptospira sp. GIMC2001]WCL51436.1 hypothetical protein O4O04_20180 [Leptospira sp. GIMC2001]
MNAKQILKDLATDLYGFHFNEMLFICVRGVTIENNTFLYNDNRIDDWNDTIALFDKNDYFKPYKGTVDSGQFFIDNPLHKDGAGYVLPGITTLQLGLHKKKKAFVQTGEVLCYRDSTGNGTWEEKVLGKATGANLHAAWNLIKVGTDSALCSVPRLLWSDQMWKNDFILRAEKSGQKRFLRLYVEARELALYIGEKYNDQSTKDFAHVLYENRQNVFSLNGK